MDEIERPVLYKVLLQRLNLRCRTAAPMMDPVASCEWLARVVETIEPWRVPVRKSGYAFGSMQDINLPLERF